MLKNASINQISIVISVLVGLGVSIFLVLYFILTSQLFDYIDILYVCLLAMITCFVVVRLILERFVFRQIKLIYKIIRQNKLGDDNLELKSKPSKYTLDEVNEEVIQWAQKTKSEIKYLKDLESYRRNYVGNLSHELKTPIFSIDGFIHTLLDGGLYDEKINRNYLKRAASNVTRLKNIVEDLEIINQLESGEIGLQIVDFDIKALTNEVFEDLSVLADEKDITLQFKEGADKNYRVKADRENIRQVFVNLITNAIKYGVEGGYIKVSFYSLDERLLVEVSDNGMGIEKSHLKHVFDRFYRVDSSRSRTQGGSGLGLSIVKHIIEAHGETINLRSTPGVGSTFGFTLRKQ